MARRTVSRTIRLRRMEEQSTEKPHYNPSRKKNAPRFLKKESGGLNICRTCCAGKYEGTQAEQCRPRYPLYLRAVSHLVNSSVCASTAIGS